MGKIYARVNENREILEYPVLAEHIAARCHPLTWYTEVLLKSRPECPKFSYLKENLYFQGDVIISEVSITPMAFDVILHNYVYGDNDPRPDKYITEVTPDVVAALLDAGKAPIQGKLDAYARDHGYDDIVSMCSYATDPDEGYRTQGQMGVNLRSSAWRALFEYFAAVSVRSKPIPKLYEEVLALLPVELSSY